MPSITIEIPRVITTETRGEKIEIPTDKWGPEFVAYLVARGLQENITNATAGKKGADAADAILTKAAQMTAGIVPSGGGGRKLDPVEKAAREIAAPAMVNKGLYKTRAEAMKAITTAGDVRTALDGIADEPTINAIYAAAQRAVDATKGITI